MRQILREAIRLIEQAGGKEISVREGGRHTHIDFQNPDGERQMASLHRGSDINGRFAGQLRSQLRRKGLRL
jgi:hypothetical protein